MPPEIAHSISLNSLNILYKLNLLKFISVKTSTKHIFNFEGMVFKNRLGTAAGLDKNGDFIVKYFIYYSSEEYFFQITKSNKDIGKYFPYFAKMSNLQNIEIWIKSICLTLDKKQKIVIDLKEGLNKRKEFKSKYKV